MSKLQPKSQERATDTSVIEISGHEPAREHWRMPSLVSQFGGNGLSLSGVALSDAGFPPCVRGANADNLVEALEAAIRIVAGQGEIGVFGQSRCRREIVIVLFTDLVAWTQLASHMMPDDADELLHRHLSSLRVTVDACGGTEVKGLGDGTMVAFSTASAALRCAVEMQRAVDRDNRLTGRPLSLRVGLSGGEVTREGGDYYGASVIEAARLCARASGGEILATQVVKELAGRRTGYPLRAMGPIELKGFPEPVVTFEVAWEPSPQGPTSIPSIPLLDAEAPCEL